MTEKENKGCGKQIFDEENEFNYICGTNELTRFLWEGIHGDEYKINYCEECKGENKQ
jgi:hypothetical protein